jgi:hypothetical protein
MTNAIQLIRQTAPTATESQTITAVFRRVDALEDIITRTAANRWENTGVRSWLHLQADKALHALADNPTLESAEAAHQAILRRDQASQTAEDISAAVHVAISREGSRLKPIISAIIDRTETQLESDALKHRAALQKAASHETYGSIEISAFEKTLVDLRNQIASERQWADKSPVAWMVQHRICADLQDTPAKSDDSLTSAILADLE